MIMVKMCRIRPLQHKRLHCFQKYQKTTKVNRTVGPGDTMNTDAESFILSVSQKVFFFPFIHHQNEQTTEDQLC